jgi:phage-related tail fiber protein
MIDSNSQFLAILTNVGVAKQANANALGIAWKITQMGVGDANGTDPQPSAEQNALINEWRRAPLNQLKQDPTNAAIIIAEQVIPAEVGGRWIREIGLYDADGDLVAVANCAPSFKPLLAQGSGRTQVVRMNLIVSNSASVELKIDPSVVLATREFVTSELAKQDFKHSVLVCAPGNIALTGLQTIDGVVVPAGKRVLVAKQTAGKDNGIWVAAAGAWARAADADTSEKVTPGLLVHVEQGTLYGDSGWQLVTDGNLSLGVTSLGFEMAWGRTGVGAGTYRSVTVDKYGRVVSATNPTTLSGYGILDAFTKTETSAAVSAAVAALVGAAPETLNQLNELATALGNDPNFAATIAAALGLKAPLASPVFIGDPKAPTAPVGDNDLSIANTAFVYAVLASLGIAPNTINTNVLAAGTDLNTVVTYGVYSQTAVGGATLALNYPKATAGTLTVLRGSATIVNQQYQEYNNGQLWTRSIYNGTPSAWLPLATEDYVRSWARKFSGVGIGGIGATYTVTAAQVGNWFNITTPGAEVTLPPANTLPSGATFLFRNAAGNTSVSLTSTSTITSDVSGTTLVLEPYEFVELAASGATYYVVGRGSTQGLAALINKMVTGVLTKDVSGGSSVTLTAAEAGYGVLWFTGALTANISVIVPAGQAGWSVFNRTTGNFTLTVKTAAGVGQVVRQGCQSQLMCGGTNMYFSQSGFDDAHFAKEIQSTSANALRQISGNYASILRMDGSNFYLLLTDSGDQYGNFNALRPFSVALSSGKVALANGVTMPTAAPGANNTDGANTAFVTAAVSASENSRVGEVTHFAMSTPPTGYLKRNGAAVSRTAYSALFAKIGTLYGAGDGNTTFNLPESRADFDRGWDDGRNVDTGRVFGSAQDSQNLSHSHTGTTNTTGAHTHTTTFSREKVPGGALENAVLGDRLDDGYQYLDTNSAGSHTHTLNIGNSGGNESRPPNTAFLACIKY